MGAIRSLFIKELKTMLTQSSIFGPLHQDKMKPIFTASFSLKTSAFIVKWRLQSLMKVGTFFGSLSNGVGSAIFGIFMVTGDQLSQGWDHCCGASIGHGPPPGGSFPPPPDPPGLLSGGPGSFPFPFMSASIRWPF